MNIPILLSGSTGFVGRALQRYLQDHNFQVYPLIRSHLSGSPSFISSLPKSPIIIHTAWAGVLGSQRNSELQDSNLEISRRILFIAKQAKAQALIAFGSQAEYGNPNRVVDEDDLLRPTTVYGQRKLDCYQLLAEGCSNLRIPLTWLRLFDPYGPGDNPAWFMPYVIRSALSDVSPELTDCAQLWDYIYIDDVCSAVGAIALAAQINKFKPGCYNLSSGLAVRLKTVVDLVFEKVSPATARPLYGAVPYREDQVMHLQGCNEKLCRAFAWAPATNLELGIARTVNYFKSQST
jgi:UDP-glucose 4-epimerase